MTQARASVDACPGPSLFLLGSRNRKPTNLRGDQHLTLLHEQAVGISSTLVNVAYSAILCAFVRAETRRRGDDRCRRVERVQKLVMSRSVRVKCNDIELKLTLNASLLSKSFSDSVLTPFLKAYSTRCKLQHVLCMDDVLSVSVNEECLKELTLPASVVLLTGELVRVQVYLRAGSGKHPPILQDPFGGTSRPQEAPNAANTSSSANCRDLSMDGMSEIERIKEGRRAARLAKVADGTAPTSSSAQDAELKLEAGVRVT
eukprot:5894867-Pleurochrysis_carterae.AAC.1